MKIFEELKKEIHKLDIEYIPQADVMECIDDVIDKFANNDCKAIINCFSGEYDFLSNFYNTPVFYEGLMYSNSEAAFQAQKTLNEEIRKKFTKYYAGQAKKEGKKVILRNDWESVKESVMYEIVYDKFSRNEKLRKKLLETGDAVLEEGNAWGDRVWGTVNGIGENKLGKILMRVRKELKEENGWIPVSKRLPSADEAFYLASDMFSDEPPIYEPAQLIVQVEGAEAPTVGFFLDGKFCCTHAEDSFCGNVIAWRPMVERYIEKE